MKSLLSSVGAIFAALAASTCCVAPLLSLAGFLGVSAAHIAWLSSVKPYLISLSFGIIVYNLYRAYYPKVTEACCSTEQTNSLSKTEKKFFSKLQSKTFLWVVAGLTLGLLLLPYIQS